jgi:hypothetical protein
MPIKPSEIPYKRPRIASNRPEYGDAKDVQRVFGIKETLCYHWFRKGWIKGVLIPGTGRGGGKRLFSFASIRKLLAESSK